MTHEVVPIEVSEDALCTLLESYLHDNLDEASFSIFADQASEIGMNLPELQKAAGQAITNAAIVKIIENTIQEVENARR